MTRKAKKGTAGFKAERLIQALLGRDLNRSGGWNDEDILGSSSSKNIPWLGVAHDYAVALHTGDGQTISTIQEALWNLMTDIHSGSKSLFSGEEFSTTYSRWILVPMSCLAILIRHYASSEEEMELAGYLSDTVGTVAWIACISAGQGSSYVKPVWSKQPGQRVKRVVPSTVWGGSRSWAAGKKGKKRHSDGKWHPVSWTDCHVMCSWLYEAIEPHGDLRKVKGDNDWTGDVYKALASHIGTKPVIFTSQEQVALRRAWKFDGQVTEQDLWDWEVWMSTLDGAFPAGAVLTVAKFTDGSSFTVYPINFHDGSTCTMNLKILEQQPHRRDQMTAIGTAKPLRTNRYPEGKVELFHGANGLIQFHLSACWCDPVTRKIQPKADMYSFHAGHATEKAAVVLHIHENVMKMGFGPGAFAGLKEIGEPRDPYPDSNDEPDYPDEPLFDEEDLLGWIAKAKKYWDLLKDVLTSGKSKNIP